MIMAAHPTSEADMDQIDVQVEQHSRGLIAKISGKAEVNQIDELDRQLHLLTALSPKFVVLDMSKVAYVSSMGIGSLLRFRKDVEQTGGKVVLAALQQNVAATLRIASIDRVLPIFNSVEAALTPT